MKKFYLLITFFFFINVAVTHGQSYYFRHYQVENGLSNNTVFCCAQDNRGFMWMGTKDGLNRFDGYSFKVFKNDPDDSSSIGDNFIRSIYIDDNNNLYTGTRNGLYKYNAVQNNFTTVYKTTDEIRDIKKDATGNLWFVAGQTLIQLNEAKKQSVIYKPEKYFSSTAICIVEKKVWISTANGLLKLYDDKNYDFRSYNVFDSSQSTARWIEKIYAANDHTILVGTSNYGVKSFDIKTGLYKDLLTYNKDKTEIFARDFVSTASKDAWMATESGIFIFDSSTQSFTNLQKKYSNPYSLSDNAVYCLCRDKEGGIWAGTYFGGVNYYPKQYNAFEKYFPDYSAQSLSGNAVREICEDKYGNLWIGTEDAGLNKLDKQSGLFTQFKPTGSSSGIAYPNVHGLLARNDELWIGTFEHGLDRMNIPTGKVIKHYPGDDSSKALRSNFIVTILETKHDDIFIGTRQGLYKFDPLTESFNSIPQIPPTSFIHSLLEDKNGLLWVGTMGNGLFRYDSKTGKIVNYMYAAGSKTSISNNSITTIFLDSNGDSWFGTEGGGLCKFNAADNTFTNYTSKDGFPGNSIFKILEDSRKNLWVTTSKGLVSFSPATKNLNIYTTANGLLSDQFNYNSGYKDAAGTMYFGSVKGLISFNPDRFTTNTYTAPVYITSVQSNNQELPLVSTGTDLQKIELAYGQSSFSIDFAALSFTAPEMTKYQYIMEGLDNNWTSLKTNRKVYFTNLSPGEYTFKVKAANSSGIWNPKETILQISIRPPFWLSKWAYAFYILLVASISYWLFKNYHDRLAEKNQRQIESLEHDKEKEIYQAKIDFFTNVAHEIRTPLTLIKAPLEKIIKKGTFNEDSGNNLKIMERNTDRLIELTNQLLDFRKIETNSFQLSFVQTNVTELLMERYQSFKTIADQKNVRLTIEVSEEPVIAYIDTDSLHKIVNNLFNNAILYCKQKVEVKLYKGIESGNAFYVSFSNDGNIIPDELRDKIFEPFYRLKETQSKPGTGIGLALSKSLVALHKGDLSLMTTNGDMNTFVVRLPVYQNGIKDL